MKAIITYLLQNLPLRQPRARRLVAVRDFPDEVHIGVLDHDVEVLHGVDGFELGPVFEPDDLLFCWNEGGRGLARREEEEGRFW